MLCVRESMKCSRFKCSNRIENIGPRRDQHHNEGKSGEENNSARRRADIWRRNNVKKNGECCKSGNQTKSRNQLYGRRKKSVRCRGIKGSTESRPAVAPQPRPSVHVGVLLTSCQTVDSSHLFGSPDLDKIFFARCVQTSQWHTKKLEEGLPQGVAQICVVKECVSEDQPLWLFPIGISQIPLAHASYSKPLPNQAWVTSLSLDT